MTQKLFYAGLALDRMSEKRKDEAWLAGLIADPRSRVAPVWRTRSLVAEGDAAAAVFLSPGDLAQREHNPVLLGVAEGVAYFMTDLSHLDESEVADATGRRGRFVDLRNLGAQIDGQQGALLAYARGLAFWHSRHLFCGMCGAPNAAIEAGHVRHCTNPDCGTDHYPRIDPAVIMLVTSGDKCLLARNGRNVDAPMYSTLAGYVEPGESLEETVAREVFEEAAIRITDVDYKWSQPWPFPSSLMLGFRARALNTDIKVDGVELLDAQWFSRDFLRQEQPPDKFRMPRATSIARALIQDWLDEG